MNYLFLHGYNTSGDKTTWMHDLKEGLVARGHAVSIPNLPNSKHPSFNEWLTTAEDAYKKLPNDQPLTLLGHSMGGFLALKFTEKYTCKHLILVAPGYSDTKNLQTYLKRSKRPQEEKEAIYSFYRDAQYSETEAVDVNAITKNADEITGVFSSNDAIIPARVELELKIRFPNINSIKLVNYGHFMPVEGVHTIPELKDLL